VDSWDAADSDVSDVDAEQKAKAMVIQLLTHPKVGQLLPEVWGTGTVALGSDLVC
jgi:hypothetical protein